MKDAQPRAIALKDYQPPNYQTESVDLTFVIADGMTTVTNRMLVKRTATPDANADTNADTNVEERATLRLDGQELELVSVELDGRLLGANEFSVDDDSLTLFDVGATADITIVTTVCPEKNTSLEGLYKSSDMYCTQCEAEGFRKITYYQDRPDVSARFRTTIVADGERFPILLSNGNLVNEGVTADGRRSVTWEDPFPKPSYLFALVAGKLARIDDHFVTMSGRSVELVIYSEPHNIGQCGYAMDALKRAMAWDEQVFGREYDLDIFMIVAVDDFNMGAMENKGLNIFNTSCVLATPDTATDAAYQRVEAVVAHEYFHNWSGNRVTCRDWFQLSLKEGFTVFRDAEFSSDMNSRTVKRIEDVTFLRSTQFAEDAGPLAHPVRPASYIEISNFYTTTVYEKGAEVVAMLHTIVGPEKFRKGSDLYFDRHDGTAATTDNFVAAMQDVSDENLDQFQRWYDQAGTPVLTVQETFTPNQLRLTIVQRCPPTPGQPDKQPFHIPVRFGLIDDTGAAILPGDVRVTSDADVQVRSNEWLLHVREPTTTVDITGFHHRPTLSFLRGFSAPVRVEYDRSDTVLARLSQFDSDGFCRWDALRSLVVNEVARHQAGAPVSDTLMEVVVTLLDSAIAAHAPEQSEERFLLAAMLAPCSPGYLFEQVERIDVDGILAAVAAIEARLGAALLPRWHTLYNTHHKTGDFSAGPEGMSRRALTGVALEYISAVEEGAPLTTLLENHYLHASNLTDRRAALAQLVHRPQVDKLVRDRLFAEFYERWQHEALVVNLWFALQSGSELTDTHRLEQLEQHPAFDMKNPNRARAVYSTFGNSNYAVFHAADGSGYRFLADRAIRLDRINPQIAARLLAPLTRWQRYTGGRAQSMRAQLERIAAIEALSKDVFEVVTKSLATAD